MRLFVAVELDEAVLAVAQATAEELRRRIGDALRQKWVPTSNMHLTVRFIGHVADDRVSAVLDAIRPPLAIAPFEVALGDCGVFPPNGPPRVLWIGLREGLLPLTAMHQEFNRRLLSLGFEAENRPFSAHLTLARKKDPPRRLGFIVRENVRAVRVPAARCPITHATVFKSQLSPEGPTYATLVRVPLCP
jgi:RNA 2',3'-cyclic 3'-phosphodiesterase